MKVYKNEEVYSKKGNMAYWDSIDEISEDYVRRLAEMSDVPVSFDEEGQDLLDIGKEITELAVKLLEERCNAEFPYVDGNY